MKYRNLTYSLSALFISLGLIFPQSAFMSTAWQTGDIFFGIGSGGYDVYSSAGVYKETITDGTFPVTMGCAFSPNADTLYGTSPYFTKIDLYDVNGTHTSPSTTISTPTGGNPTSVSVAQNGDIFVGQNGGTQTVLRYNAAGVFEEAYGVATENTGSDWVELSSDQQTLFYTSQGSKILRYNIATHTQLPDYASLAGSHQFFGFAILPPGDGTNGILVADNDGVKLIDASGNEIASYGVTGAFIWTDVVMNLDGTSFWATSVFNNTAYKFNISSPGMDTQVTTLNLGINKFPFGVCVMPDVTPPTLSCTPNGANAQSGLMTLGGSDNLDTIVDLFITDSLGSGPFGPYAPGTEVKITVAKGKTASENVIGQGKILLLLPGDPLLISTDQSGNTAQISCN